MIISVCIIAYLVIVYIFAISLCCAAKDHPNDYTDYKRETLEVDRGNTSC